MSNLAVTNVGRAVARSAVMPRTAAYFLEYFRANLGSLAKLLEVTPRATAGEAEDLSALEHSNTDLGFILFHLCYCSPEFGDSETRARRFLPYQLGDRRESARADRLQNHLTVRPWDGNTLAVNAADISADWMSGLPLADLEDRFGSLRGGMIRDMLRTAASHLAGVADILTAASSPAAGTPEATSVAWISGNQRRVALRLIRRIRQCALQSLAGIPDDILWMADVTAADGHALIHRSLAMELRRRDMRRLEDLLDRGRTHLFLQVLGNSQGGQRLMGRIRQAAERARLERTSMHRARILKRLPDCEELVTAYFEARGKAFEDVLDECFRCLNVRVIERDDGNRRKSHFPDFVIELECGNVIVIECKSSQNGEDIKLSAATDVGGKAALHGLAKHHLVTICQKYVSTDVPRLIEVETNLSVINAEDMALAMAYLKSGAIGPARFVTWLTTPGQPRVEELFLS